MREKASAAWASLARRNFLTRLGLGAGILGAAAIHVPEAAAASPVGDAAWQPTRHEQDNWFDQIPGQHRFVLDISSADGVNWGLRFTNNYFAANESAYGLKASDLAVVVVTRHKATSFGYNHAMWAKYGKYFSEQAEFVDPKTKQPPTVNVYLATEGAEPGPIDEAIKKGVQFAVCNTASRGLAGRISTATGQKTDDILKEIAANLIGNARMVPAGIVAVSRAQERGYTLATVV